MSTKNKPGIHLHSEIRMDSDKHWYVMWQWYIVAKNGNIVGRSWRWYKRKSGAVKSIKVVAAIFYMQTKPSGFPGYYDHSKPDSPLQSYL
jgi:uncharacterized protein YegP (UPF0339 family)